MRFGKVTPAERMRYYRAIRAIEDAELVEPTHVIALYCKPVLYLKLTDAGEKLARDLIKET